MSTSSFPKADVLAACAQYGPLLQIVAPLNGVRVMTAIASNESSLGVNCGPRHEPAYDVGGKYGDAALLNEYGSAAACSYGPWQMMYVNYSGGYSPADLLTDLQANATEFVRFFNSYVIRGHRAVTLQDIGQIWNGGHRVIPPATPLPGVVRYCTDLQAAYDATQ